MTTGNIYLEEKDADYTTDAPWFRKIWGSLLAEAKRCKESVPHTTASALAAPIYNHWILHQFLTEDAERFENTRGTGRRKCTCEISRTTSPSQITDTRSGSACAKTALS